MKKSIKKILSLVLAMSMVMALAACGGGSDTPAPEKDPAQSETDAPAATGKEQVIKISTVHYEGSVGVRCLEAFKEYVEAESDGRMKVEIYAGGVLGDWSAVQDMLYNGDIQIQINNPVTYEQQVPEIAMLNQYYAFDDLEHVHNFFDGEGGDYVYDSLNKIGLQGVSLLSLGFRQLYNSKHPVETMEDLQGLKIRGYSPVQIGAWKAVGVEGVSIDWNELFVSLQQKLIDGEEGATVNFQDYSFYEVQPYFTLTDHVFSCDMGICTPEWLESQTPEDLAILEAGFDVMTQYHKEHYIPENEALLEKFAAEYGTQINELDPAVKAEMAEKMGAATKTMLLDMCGEEVYNEYMALVDAARG